MGAEWSLRHCLEDQLLPTYRSRSLIPSRPRFLARKWISKKAFWHVLRDWWARSHWYWYIHMGSSRACGFQATSLEDSIFVSAMLQGVIFVLSESGNREYVYSGFLVRADGWWDFNSEIVLSISESRKLDRLLLVVMLVSLTCMEILGSRKIMDGVDPVAEK